MTQCTSPLRSSCRERGHQVDSSLIERHVQPGQAAGRPFVQRKSQVFSCVDTSARNSGLVVSRQPAHLWPSLSPPPRGARQVLECTPVLPGRLVRSYRTAYSPSSTVGLKPRSSSVRHGPDLRGRIIRAQAPSLCDWPRCSVAGPPLPVARGRPSVGLPEIARRARTRALDRRDRSAAISPARKAPRQIRRATPQTKKSGSFWSVGPMVRRFQTQMTGSPHPYDSHLNSIVICNPAPDSGMIPSQICRGADVVTIPPGNSCSPCCGNAQSVSDGRACQRLHFPQETGLHVENTASHRDVLRDPGM